MEGDTLPAMDPDRVNVFFLKELHHVSGHVELSPVMF